MNYSPIFIVAVPVLIIAAAAGWHWSSRKPKRGLKSWLFSDKPEDISLRSADNLRLLGEDQLRSYEDENEEEDE